MLHCYVMDDGRHLSFHSPSYIFQAGKRSSRIIDLLRSGLYRGLEVNHSEILKLCILSTVGWFNKKIISPFFYVADAVSVAPTSDGNQGQVEKSSILNSSGATGEEERDTKIEKETDDSELAAGLLYICNKDYKFIIT